MIMSRNTKSVIRIAVASAVVIIAIILEHTIAPDWIILFATYAAAFLVAGYDVLWKAVTNIAHGKVFDENFLMTIATIGA